MSTDKKGFELIEPPNLQILYETMVTLYQLQRHIPGSIVRPFREHHGCPKTNAYFSRLLFCAVSNYLSSSSVLRMRSSSHIKFRLWLLNFISAYGFESLRLQRLCYAACGTCLEFLAWICIRFCDMCRRICNYKSLS